MKNVLTFKRTEQGIRNIERILELGRQETKRAADRTGQQREAGEGRRDEGEARPPRE